MCNNIIFALTMAAQNTYGQIIGELAATYGYSDVDITVFGICFIVGGILGCIFFGIILDNWHNYKTVLVTIMVLGTTATILIYFLINRGSTVFMGSLCIMLGFAMISISVVSFDLGVEQLYPLGESNTPMVLGFTSAVTSLALLQACTYFLE